MSGERRLQLTSQLDWYWEAVFLPRLEGLVDEEYLWEPVDGAWNVRPRSNGRFGMDWEEPEPDPAPFTTIAWRVSHIGHVLAERANYHFGDRSYPETQDVDCPGDTSSAMDFLTRSYEAWAGGVGSLTDAELGERREGPPNTLDGSFPFAEVILHVNREVIHHGAEVAVLRDLYRHHYSEV